MTLPKAPTTFPPAQHHFIIEGPAGNLEVLTQAASHPPYPQQVAVICHPHPLYQGTMHNKVVTTLAKAFDEQGLHTVRFNYRGVGHSEGTFGDSIGEVADLMAVLAWIDQVLDHPKIWLAGFSFGAYIAAQGAQQHGCEQLYSVAPAVSNQPYDTLALTCPWTVIQPEADEVISPEAVYHWYEKHFQRGSHARLIKVPDCSHFFHGKLILLRGLIAETFIPAT